MSDLLNGHIQKRRVKCGKQNCKCAKGEPHTAFYHVWHCDGQRYQRFVRKSEVKMLRRQSEQSAAERQGKRQAVKSSGELWRTFRLDLLSSQGLIKELRDGREKKKNESNETKNQS